MLDTKGILAEQICSIKKKSLQKRKTRDTEKAIASWIEDDRLISGPGKALVIILNSRGCEWGLGINGGCSMCGYSNETSAIDISANNLVTQVKGALEKSSTKEFQSIKIFNSGSFLDTTEIPVEAQTKILSMINELESVSEVIVESRPEFVTQKILKNLRKTLDKNKQLEIGIGLETSNDLVRINNINKGFLFKDYKEAVKIALSENTRVKTYLLLKPPFLTEKEAISDTVQSAIAAIKSGSRSISINPINVQSGTFVYNLWRNGIYRPPWFWTLKSVLLEIWKQINKQKLDQKVDRILSDPSGAGTRRGIHNCYKCNKDFNKTIKEYSLNQDYTMLNKIFCSCQNLWLNLLKQEEASRDYSLQILENPQNLL
ncbi:MAG: TIGR01210 family radical SAM protein [Asgard group archaeon]|nr:TIGR01210 family radical SAM protein [Asgard group archaeon]